MKNFTTVAKLKLASLVSGQRISTTGYRDGWAASVEPQGAATYQIATLAEVRTAKGDGGWIPDEYGNHTLANGNVAMLDVVGEIQAAQFGVDGVTDSAAAILAAVNYAGGRTVRLPREVRLDTIATITNDVVDIRGHGDGTHLDCSGGGGLDIFNTVTSLPNLSSDVVAGDNNLTFASAHGLVEGDLVALHNPTDYTFAPFRPYYRDGCMFKISSVAGLGAETYGLSPSTFAFGDMDAYQINGQGVHLEGFKVTPRASGISIWIDAHQRVKVHNIKGLNGSDLAFMEIWRCYDVDVVNDSITQLDGSGSYPVSFANCQKVTVTRCNFYTLRHCFSTGGRDGVATVPSRDFIVNQCHMFNNSDLGLGASDVHGSVEGIRYSDCIIDAHANIAGKNASYVDCRIKGRPASYGSGDGSMVFGGELVGGYFEFDNCEFETYGSMASVGGIDLDISEITEDISIQLINCRMVNKSATPTTANILTLLVGSASPPTAQIDVVIKGLEYVANSPPVSIVKISGSNDVSGNLSIMIDDDLIAPDQTPLVAASNVANYTAPMRLPTQRVAVDIDTIIGTFQAISANQAFRYRYPKVPTHFTCGAGTATGAAQSASTGGKVNLPWVYSYDRLQLRLSLNSGDGGNWTSVATVATWAEASIRDF